MKVRKLVLKKFKRFDDLTIDLGPMPPRIVALVGPNGCGKSTVFDAFEEKLKDVKGVNRASLDASFFLKSMYSRDAGQRGNTYQKHVAITIEFAGGDQQITKKSFHVRSPYRFTSRLKVDSIAAQPSVLDDPSRPGSSVEIDSRLQENFARLHGSMVAAFWKGEKTGPEVRQELVGRVNDALANVLDVRITDLGDVTQGKGQLYFEKGEATNFPYEILSSGEKEVVDLVIDLIIRAPEYDQTVYCIDEPELHLNTAIQRKLLKEIEKLLPAGCQLWVSTHSIGFLRALQDDLADKCAVLDFSEKDYFVGAHTIKPMDPTRANWQRIFATALDDLVGLIAPERIVYCEGRAEPTPAGEEQGLDAIVYNEAFGKDHADTLFISSGGTNEVKSNGSLAVKVLSKAFSGVELLLLHDRDTRTNAERTTWLANSSHHRMLARREIENYLFDYEVLHAYAQSKARTTDKAAYDTIVTDVRMQDLKAGQTTANLKALCGEPQMTNAAFKKALAPFITGTAAYTELETAVFNVIPPTTPAALAPPPTGIGGAP